MTFWIIEQHLEQPRKIAFTSQTMAERYSKGFSMFCETLPYEVEELPRDAKVIC